MKLAYPYEEQRMQSFLRPLLSHTDAIGNWGVCSLWYAKCMEFG